MARKKMINRTITTNIYEVLCVNIETNETFIQKVPLEDSPKNPDKLFKAISLKVNNNAEKAVCIKGVTTESKKYAMSVENFILSADVVEED